ncbi:hypothetical protein [Chitinophaga caseinilytica]|uniref:hypothetical protein n=1 Tax=Chitinophaga caseinilytica TaxID=2267521 RepID=UPI003C2E9B49
MIRKMKRSVFFVLLLAAAVSCKKSGEGEAPAPTLPDPQPVTHGIPEGTPVTKTIGAAGGTIQSADGNIAIEIPAGAVSAATNFSIQPVSSTLTAGTGPSYRLLPENVQFQKDVKITLKYADTSLIGTTEDDLYLAYQDKEGFWHRVIMTAIDKTNKTLSAQTRHFSDWTIERIFRIEIAQSDRILEANEQAMLMVMYQDVKKGTDQIIQGVWVPDQNIETWFATGPGTFDNTKHHKVYFKAPASIPQHQEIAVGVRIRNLVSQRHPDRPGNGGLVIVQVPVTLLPEEYFIWYVDGTTNVAYSMDAALLGTNTTLLGTGITGGVGIFMNGAGLGKYVSGSAMEPKKFNVQLSISNGNPPIYLSEYYPCGGTGVMYGSGDLNISSYGSIGQSISGYFTAMVYAPGSGCNPKPKKVSGSFRLKRKV